MFISISDIGDNFAFNNTSYHKCHLHSYGFVISKSAFILKWCQLVRELKWMSRQTNVPRQDNLWKYFMVTHPCSSCWLYVNVVNIKGWAQDWRKSDGCFPPNLISSPWGCYEDYNISFCKQWKFRCHCSYEQWHLNLHCLQRGPSCP